MDARGWDECDIILVSGDAYVDHPHFGVAVVGRLLEAEGYRVGIIDQPDWRSTDDFQRLGRPRLFFGVTSGNMESGLARLTVNRKLRSRDAYSPGGKTDRRPKRAAIVYANRLREAFGECVIILGGLEASLRRLAHYDFWEDAVRRSMLIDAKADMILYGMAEKSILEVARRLESGLKPRQILDVPGTVVCSQPDLVPEGTVELPSFRDVIGSKRAFNEAFRIFYENNDPKEGKPLLQKTNSQWVFHNPPSPPLSTEEIDRVFELPYTRRWHPKYDETGGVPALETVRFSVATHRGCFGNCNFCSLAAHQGNVVQSRSLESVVREVRALVEHPDFNGTIVDVGGPTANMYGMGCKAGNARCKDRSCLVPEACPNLDTDLSRHLDVLRAVREVDGVRRVFVASGIRHDLCLVEGGREYLQELCQHHIGGRLKIAPEHTSPAVLKAMNKPHPDTYEAFSKLFAEIQQGVDRDQYLVQYFMAGHPGCRHQDMVKLAEYLRDRRLHPEQAQDFYPTPLTVSACIYYTGFHPLTGEKVFTTTRERERLMQRAMIHYWEPKNYKLVREALRIAKRKDLIGAGGKCLVPPDETGHDRPARSKGGRSGSSRGSSRGGSRGDSRGSSRGRRDERRDSRGNRADDRRDSRRDSRRDNRGNERRSVSHGIGDAPLSYESALRDRAGSGRHGSRSRSPQGRGGTSRSRGGRSDGNRAYGSRSRGNRADGNRADGNRADGNRADGNRARPARGNRRQGNHSSGNR
jgi:uncharacterized radical SAM protein YgiQ